MQIYRYLQEGVMKDAAFGIPFSTWCFSLSPEEYLLNTAAQAASIDELLELTEDNVTAFTLSNGKQNLVVWIVKINHTTLLGRDDYSLLPPLLTHQYDRMGCDGT